MKLPSRTAALFITGLAMPLVVGIGQGVRAQSADCIDRLGAFMGGGWGHMFFGGVMMLFFWAGLIALIAVAVRWVASGSGGSDARNSSLQTPRQILDERFARGEIDKNEFDARKQALAN